MTVSHVIVILLILTCQLDPMSNSHISGSFVASVYKTAFSNVIIHSRAQLGASNVSLYLLEYSSMYIRASLVCSTLRVSIEYRLMSKTQLEVEPTLSLLPMKYYISIDPEGTNTPPFNRDAKFISK